MPRWARILAGIAVAGGAFGLLVAWSGILNIGASTGHWAITEWALHAAMRQSVETHSMRIETPPLDDPALARRAAGHYAGSCVHCHGAPGMARSAFALGMVPQPPLLEHRVPEWEDHELFWIVRHGVKFTGMPAWPALARTDEIWAMVAFLRRLPALDETGYRRLAHGDGDAEAEAQAQGGAADALAGCIRCHGQHGRGGGAFPRLAGQNEAYLYAQLRAYAEGTRHSGIMQSATAQLDAAAMRALARHYARVEAPAPTAPRDAAATGAGARLAREGDAAAGIPACASCHGLAAGPRYPHYPRLAGQPAWYLALQLRLFRSGERGGSAYAHIMRSIGKRLSDDHIAAVAKFYSGGQTTPTN